MHGNEFFYQAFIYLSAAVIAVPIAKKLGLGSVLGYLLAGIIIGPYVLELVGEEGQDVMHFAEFGVVMMLFLVGLELKPSLLWKLRLPILGLGGLQLFLTTAIITGIILFVSPLNWNTGLALGLTLALSSTAIVLQTLNEKGLTKTEGGQNAFLVLLFQDVSVIPILALLPLLAMDASLTLPEQNLWIDQFPLGLKTIIVLSGVGIIIFGGKHLISPAFRLIAQTHLRELFTAAALLLVISIALLMIQVGLSPALGTFLAGVVLAQSEYRHELESDIEPFKGLLLGLFFIAVGASFDFQLIKNDPLLILGMAVGLISIKFLILLLIGKVFGMKHHSNFLFSFSLAQGGEFAFVLLSFALQNNVMDASIADPMIATVAITMALTPLLMIVNEKMIQPYVEDKKKDDRNSDTIDQHHSVIVAGFGRFGSTIGRFLRANGVTATFLDIDPNNVDLLRKLGLNVFYGDASRHDLLKAAGAENAALLIIAVDNPAKSLQIAETAKKYFPNLPIMARTHSWIDHYNMIDAGVDQLYREYLDSALRMGAEALTQMGFRQYQIGRSLKLFRKKDERMVKELSELRHHQGDFITSTKQRIEDMETMMKNDINRYTKDKDMGWDTASLKAEFGPYIKDDTEI